VDTALRESAEKNVIKHLTHIEDLVITDYVAGAKRAVSILNGLTAFFAGHANAPVNLSVKIDGSPAIVVGNDPADGRFFVGTKGAFAKTPRIAKSVDDIKRLYSGKEGLIDTMTVAFNALKGMTFSHILQGDVLFTPSIKNTQVIDGRSYVTFKPNTIVYGVPSDSDFGKQIIAAKFGVCFHTTYNGSSLATLHAAPGANISTLRPTSAVVMFSSRYQDLSGSLSFTASETQTLKTLIADIKTRTPKLSNNPFVSALQDTPLLQSEFMIFQNELVRSGDTITLSPKVFVARFIAHLTARGEQDAAKKSSPTGKQNETEKYQMLSKIVTEQESALVDVLAWQHAVTIVKTFMIGKLNTVGTLETFYTSDTGIVAGNHEGFVASDRQGNFVKLVDRSEFSAKNFTQGRFR
jgi:hypothetical protein